MTYRICNFSKSRKPVFKEGFGRYNRDFEDELFGIPEQLDDEQMVTDSHHL